ncbi:septum formation family protein [Microbacterium sp. 22242]|uniref:septum formation family protein n=1 Tax=Microbacterium sp. 22242 TaxID=3453896 RepID=UPI003F839B87
MNERTVLRRLAVLGSAAVLAVGLSGCSLLSSALGGGGDAPRDDKSGKVTQSSNVDIFNLKVGDCKLKDSGTQISETDVVPCDKPHDEEVYYEFKLADGEYDSSVIDTEVNKCAEDAFTSFIGVAYDASSLDVSYMTPTKDTWEKMNDRLVQCIVSDPAGQTIGSLKGAAR